MAEANPDRSAMIRVQSASPLARRKRLAAHRKDNAQLGASRSADLWLMLLLLAMSGNPVFATDVVYKVFVPILAVVLGLRTFTLASKVHRDRALRILVYFGVIVTVQAVQFMYFPTITLLGLFCRLTVAYAFSVLISDFAGTYIRALMFLAVMAMFFFFANLAGSLVGLDLAGLTQNFAFPVATNTGSWTFLLHSYSVNPTDATRDAGMFWEPGAFAGYLNLALVLLCLTRNRFPKRVFLFRFVVLSICLLTTQSTMGYICFALVIFLAGTFSASSKPKSRVIPVAITLCIFAGFAAFALNQDFIIPKIEHSFVATTTETGSWQADRLGSLIFDFTYISAKPLIGWGISDDTRLMLDPDLQGNALIGRGNGMSDFAAKFGVPALFLWLYCLYKTFLAVSQGRKLQALMGLTVILIALNDECFLNYPLFLSFFFVANLFGGRAVEGQERLKELSVCPE